MKSQPIHVISYCVDCSWMDDNYLTSSKEARKHNMETGHLVTVETGYSFQYKRKIKRNAEVV